MDNVNAKLARIISIKNELDLRKELYDELDKLVLELKDTGFKSFDMEGLRLELVDNFEETNVCYRPAGVKRWEMKIESLEKVAKREARASKKAGA